jgi:2-aminoadipate transaminase
MPTFQNPTGRTASPARRARLARVLRRHGALANEDDVYWELRYEGDPVASLWSYAPANVVYLTSLSKNLAPATRAGILVLPSCIEQSSTDSAAPGIDWSRRCLTAPV